MQKQKKGVISLQIDLTDFSDILSLPENKNVTIDKLNDEYGIALTLKKGVRYHKSCRRYCNSSRVKRIHRKQSVSEATSLKKLSSSDDTEITNRDIKQ